MNSPARRWADLDSAQGMAADRERAARADAPLRAVEGGAASAPATGIAPRATELRLCLIDDDSAFVRVIANRAEALGWHQRLLASPPRVEDIVALRPSAVLLDPGVCPGDPFEYLAELSRHLPQTGIVVATEPCPVADRVRGLRVGADDWIAKPAHPEEVVARLQAVVRRRNVLSQLSAPAPIVGGELEVRPDRFQAYVAADSVQLTRREYELLELLAGAEGRVLEREEIYSRVWGYTMPRGDRSVDVFVRKVRTKLRTASPGWRYVHTHFGVGYRFDPEPVTDDDPET